MNLDHIPVIRLAEVYLNRAEARVMLGNDAGARADLHKVRQRARSQAPMTEAAGDWLLLEILEERRIELCYEGHRLFDMTRHHTDLVQEDFVPYPRYVQYPNPFFILPIPHEELAVNPNMVQNPGY